MMESDAVGNGAADDRIEVVVESAGTSSNDESDVDEKDVLQRQPRKDISPKDESPPKSFEIGGVCVIKFHTQELHKKYFSRVKHHLEQMIWDSRSELPQQFYVDTAKTEATPPPKQIYESVKNSSLVEEVEGSQAKISGGRSCFNCLGDHHMTECTQPIDRKAIAENRRKLQTKQQGSNNRFFEDEERSSKFVAGRWSRRLLEAMGVRRNELPPFVYRMRVLGYPPGWLQEAELESSGLKIFDGHGNEVKKGPNVKKLKKNTNAVAEDGEVSSGGSEDFDSEDETEEQIRYDPNKLIEIPGFNVPMPPGWQDDHRRFGMPPLQPHQMKENALLALKTTKKSSQATAGRRMNLPPPTDNRKCVAAEHPATGMKRKLQLPPPKNEVVISDDEGDSTKNELPRKRVKLGTEHSEVSAEIKDEADSDTNGDLPADQNDDLATTSNTPMKLRRSKSLGSVPGTPIPVPISRVESLPDAQKWSEGVADHIPFENLPGATGTFEKMRGLLAKIKELKNSS